MQFRKGTHIYTKDGKDVGAIDRVVMNPRTNEVTHLIVRQGFLFTEDKVMPIEWVDTTQPDVVTLQESIENLDALPKFEEEFYVSVIEEVGETWPTVEEDLAQPLYGYPADNTAWWQYPGYPGFVSKTYKKQTVRAIPANAVALKEGAKVISRDDEHVGNVEKIFVDENTDRATHFIVSQGLLEKKHKLIPTAWIDSLEEDEVRVLVNSKLIEKLVDHKESTPA